MKVDWSFHPQRKHRAALPVQVMARKRIGSPNYWLNRVSGRKLSKDCKQHGYKIYTKRVS